jgi:precorrin isomerase
MTNKKRGVEKTIELKSKIGKYILRRDKAELIRKKLITTQKNDFVAWIYLTQPQIDAYREVLASEEVKEVLKNKNLKEQNP